MHNTYVFFSSDDETKIGVTISVGYEDGKGLCFSSAQFYKMDEGDCECGINHGDDEAHEDDDEQHGLAEALDELKVTDKWLDGISADEYNIVIHVHVKFWWRVIHLIFLVWRTEVDVFIRLREMNRMNIIH